jgi:pyruvate/2-oxoglutarate dehydrogenase complex dihydrolipoamide acyltransferase (E2) component
MMFPVKLITAGCLLRWVAREGEDVSAGDPVAVMEDANGDAVEIGAICPGKLVKHNAVPNTNYEAGRTIAYVQVAEVSLEGMEVLPRSDLFRGLVRHSARASSELRFVPSVHYTLYLAPYQAEMLRLLPYYLEAQQRRTMGAAMMGRGMVHEWLSRRVGELLAVLEEQQAREISAEWQLGRVRSSQRGHDESTD